MRTRRTDVARFSNSVNSAQAILDLPRAPRPAHPSAHARYAAGGGGGAASGSATIVFVRITQSDGVSRL